MFDYFYGAPSDQFSFYRVPKELFTNDRFKNLSAEAKMLYSILLDRVTLSSKNGWKDERGRVYIICTIDEIMHDIDCGNKKAIKLLTDLEKKVGLIERKRQGQGNPNLIYVKNFNSVVDNPVERHFKECQNDTSGSVGMTSLDVSKVHGNNTDTNNTDCSDTYPFLSADGNEGMRERAQYESYFRESLSFDLLLQEHRFEGETLEGILDLLVDTCCSRQKTIRIARDDKPTVVVQSRFMKLTNDHIDYVLTCLQKNTTEIHNMKQYLLAALYNAPTTISPYYQARVNNDMASGKF